MSTISNDCFADVLSDIETMLKTKNTIIVAIDGKSGSGKSRLAALLKNEFDCNVFHMDDFFLAPEQRTPQRLAEVGGNIDYERFEEEIIDNIKSGLDFRYEKYNCRTETFEDSDIVTQKQLNIIEGVYSHHPLFSDFYDYKIFLSVDLETQKKRIWQRGGEDMFRKYFTQWIPLENLYFKSNNTAEKSDVFIDTSVFW